jgi:hypothetical protein
LEKDRNCFPRDLVGLCSKEGDLCDQIVNRPELSGFDLFADTFLNLHIEFVDSPEEVGNGVGSLAAAGQHLKLCRPENSINLTFGVKVNATVVN